MTPSISEVDYAPNFSESIRGFSLNIGCNDDYACFAIWHGALSKQDEIVTDLSTNFELIGDFTVHWSEQNYNNNIERLYERISRPSVFNGYDGKIGPTPFRFLVIRDRNPQYTWKRSVSGLIEPTNEAVVAAKYKYRSWFEKPFQVHSSNNLSELLFQLVLVLGPERMSRALCAEDVIKETLHKDLEGADGWDNWRHLFSVLNVGCNYLVLRNYEGLPDRMDDADIDIQCDNFQRIASAANVKQSAALPFKGLMRISGDNIPVDIRFVGDGYYPAVWQMEMLRRRQLKDGIYVLAPDDLFFSILYHSKIQKPFVSQKYANKLQQLADELRFDWYSSNFIEDDEKCREYLGGYLRGRQLSYEVPVDRGVYANGKIIAGLPQRMVHFSAPRRLFREIKAKAKKALREPRQILPYVLRRMGLRNRT